LSNQPINISTLMAAVPSSPSYCNFC